MQEGQIARVAELMARMAQGDAAAAFMLYEEFGAVIRRVLRGFLVDVGTREITPADLDGLTLDAVVALLDAAPAWRPDGGAMPWTWAERKLRALVRAHVGIYADEFGDAHDRVADVPSATDHIDRDEIDSLKRVAADNATVRLLIQALAECCTERDAQLLLAVKAQAAAGDPSPANTVAAQRGMTPAAVRKVVSRARAALRALAESNARYAPLRDLALIVA